MKKKDFDTKGKRKTTSRFSCRCGYYTNEYHEMVEHLEKKPPLEVGK